MFRPPIPHLSWPLVALALFAGSTAGSQASVLGQSPQGEKLAANQTNTAQSLEGAWLTLLWLRRQIDPRAGSVATPAVYIRFEDPQFAGKRAIVKLNSSTITRTTLPGLAANPATSTPVLPITQAHRGLTDGEVIVELEIAESDIDAKASGTRFTETCQIENLAGTDIVELILKSGNWWSGASLTCEHWRPDPDFRLAKGALNTIVSRPGPGNTTLFQPGSRVDPRVRAALFQSTRGDYDPALNTLLQLRGGQPDQILPEGLLWALAEVALRADVLGEARRALTELGRRRAEEIRLSRLRSQLAAAYLQRGDFTTSAQYLAEHGSRPPKGVGLEWQSVHARLLMAQGDFGGAASLLDQVEAVSSTAWRNLDQPYSAFRLSSYARYNKAVAMVRSGRVREGRAWLDIVGQIKAHDHALETLRDKANNSLGWQLLRSRHGRTATAVLSRIRLDGPYSASALLGSGWALLLEQSDENRVVRLGRNELSVSTADPHLPDDIVEMLIDRGVLDSAVYGEQNVRRMFARHEAPADQKQAAMWALRYWDELAEGDIREPAVQEGLVAVAYAQQLLNNPETAAHRYEVAIKRIEKARFRVMRARKLLGVPATLTSLLKELADDRATPDDPRGWIFWALAHRVDLYRLSQYRTVVTLLVDSSRIAYSLSHATRRSNSNGDPVNRSAMRAALLDAQTRLELLRSTLRSQLAVELDATLQDYDNHLEQYLLAAYLGYANTTDVE